MSLEGQLSAIEECNPDIVIIDSINRIVEFGSGVGKNIKLIIDGNGEQRGYRDILKGRDTHVIFISHLNGEGEIKGSTDLKHLPDVLFYLKNADNNKFTIQVNKNRYGRSDKESLWEKVDDGVDCLSHNRYEEVFKELKKKGIYDEISQQIEKEEIIEAKKISNEILRDFYDKLKLTVSDRKFFFKYAGIPWDKNRYKVKRPWTKEGLRKMFAEWDIENKRLCEEFGFDWDDIPSYSKQLEEQEQEEEEFD